jgi:Lamin-B receptor of TUDOR domain
MDLHPERYYNSGRRIEVYWDGDGVYYRGTVTGYSVNTRKYTILYDDNDVERVCLEVSFLFHRFWKPLTAPSSANVDLH